MKARQLCALVLVGGMSFAGAGCVALAVGAAAAAAGTYVYFEGKLTDTENVPLDTAWNATLAAVKDLGFRIDEQRKDALEGYINAEEADGTDLWIWVESQGEKITKFTIRAGVIGDESKSRTIMDKIKSHF